MAHTMHRITQIGGALVLGASLALAGGCQTNPATGKTIYAPLSASQQLAMGEQAAPQLAQEFGGPVHDPQLQAYVTQVGKKLAAQTESNYPSLPWEFTLLDSPVVNAFSLPGGKVFLTRGLMEKMNNEAQLAGVLGHEIGHVTAQHVAQQVGQAQILQGVSSVAGLAVSEGGGSAGTLGQLVMPALNVGGQLYMLKFSRTDESQADALGMRYMSKAGYNPRGQLEVMEILKSLGGGGAEFLQTHPLPETRIKQVQNLLDTTYKAQASDPNYGLFPERIAPYIARLRQLPPPPQPKTSGSAQGAQLRGGRQATPARNQVISRPAR
jgi:predicted Zn-dependent protease